MLQGLFQYRSYERSEHYIKETEEHKNELLDLSLALDEQIKYSIHLEDSIRSMLTFNNENVLRYLDYFEIAHKDIVYKQSLIETGNFSSEIFHQNNNLFGMHNPYKRATTSTGSNRHCATYSTYLESIKDYKIYQDYYYKGGNYYNFLQRIGYAEDSVYITKLKNR